MKEQQRSILIIDDSPEDREFYRRLLSKTWAEDVVQVLEAESGAEGLERCQKHTPEIILLDYRLHDMKQRELILELEKARRLERELAYHDTLTQLPNRRLFTDRLKHAIGQAKRNRGKVALLNLDLDGFRKVNDSCGHEVGDHLLQSVAIRLRECIRDCDTVARLGGDEFSIVLENIVQMQDAGKVAKKILEAICFGSQGIDDFNKHWH